MELIVKDRLGLLEAGQITNITGYEILPYSTYSSPRIWVDNVKTPRTNVIKSVMSYTEPPLQEQLYSIQSYFSLSKSDLAKILHITRPALYAWFDGTSEPGPDNAQRIKLLYSMIDKKQATYPRPLFHAYIQRPIAYFRHSLIEALSQDKLNRDEINTMLQVITKMTEERNIRVGKYKSKKSSEFSVAEQEQILDSNIVTTNTGD